MFLVLISCSKPGDTDIWEYFDSAVPNMVLELADWAAEISVRSSAGTVLLLF